MTSSDKPDPPVDIPPPSDPASEPGGPETPQPNDPATGPAPAEVPPLEEPDPFDEGNFPV